jgi:lipid-binding SYLF domain-containing protein
MGIVKTTAVAVSALFVATSAFAKANDSKKLAEATTVVTEFRNAGDNGIPEDLWNKAQCVLVIPNLKKAGFIIGGESGSGVLSCKNAGRWSAPVFMQLSKGSVGLQAGVSSTDLVLLVMNRGGEDKLFHNKVTLGADASIAAGPVGRTATAGTNAQMSAELLSYSHSKGLFAGIDLSGGALTLDDSANQQAYGSASAQDIALGKTQVTMSPGARAFTEALGRDVRGTSGVAQPSGKSTQPSGKSAQPSGKSKKY